MYGNLKKYLLIIGFLFINRRLLNSSEIQLLFIDVHYRSAFLPNYKIITVLYFYNDLKLV